MSHEEYWDYLQRLDEALQDFLLGSGDLVLREKHLLWFKLTASPYHYWLQNIRALEDESSTNASKTPQESSVGKESVELARVAKTEARASVRSPSNTEDSSILFDKAQLIRSKARESIAKYMEVKVPQMPQNAHLDLWKLATDWASGQSIYKALDSIPDSELVKWNTKHEVFV